MLERDYDPECHFKKNRLGEAELTSNSIMILISSPRDDHQKFQIAACTVDRVCEKNEVLCGCIWGVDGGQGPDSELFEGKSEFLMELVLEGDRAEGWTGPGTW